MISTLLTSVQELRSEEKRQHLCQGNWALTKGSHYHTPEIPTYLNEKVSFTSSGMWKVNIEAAKLTDFATFNCGNFPFTKICHHGGAHAHLTD